MGLMLRIYKQTLRIVITAALGKNEQAMWFVFLGGNFFGNSIVKILMKKDNTPTAMTTH